MRAHADAVVNGTKCGFHQKRQAVLPVISDGPYGFQHVNVAEQRRDPNSLLNWMERMIRMRKEVPEIGWGDFSFRPHETTSAILAMRYDWRNNSVLFLHNLSSEPQEVAISVCFQKNEGSGTLVNLLRKITAIRKRARHCVSGTIWIPLVSSRRP